MEEEKNSESALHVKDHRRFNADGSLRKDLSERPEDTRDEPSRPPPQTKSSRLSTQESSGVEMNFVTLVLSLASSVQISLGLIENPMTAKKEVNLASAKQTIDILGILEEKTRGNLEKEEEDLLKQVVYQLRVYYVEESKKVKT